MPVKHSFTSAKADGADATLVRPSNWNADHTITEITATQDAQTNLTLTDWFYNGVMARNAWAEFNIQNKSAGASASTDFIVTKDTGTSSAGYADFGINGSAYSVGTWTVNGAGDAYVYCDGGTMDVGTATAGKNVQVFTGGTLAANIRAKFGDTYSALVNQGTEERLGGVLWTKTSATTLSNFTTAATLIGAVGTGVGTLTLPANALAVGRTIRLKMRGYYGTTTAAPTLNFTVTLGGVTVVTSGAITMTTVSMSNRPWWLEVEITCRATGTTATVIGNGIVTGANTLAVHNSWLLVGTAAVNVNTGATAALGVTVACGTANAANTITCHHATVEIIG